MSIFSQLIIHANADAWWVVVLGGHDKVTGELVEFHCLLGHNHHAVVGGVVTHFRAVWLEGSPVEWTEAITQGSSDREFWGSGSSSAGEHRWSCLPDPAMRRRLKGVNLDEKFHLCGWGSAQIDGTPFDWGDRDFPVRGVITKTRVLPDGLSIEVTYVDDELDLDAPLQQEGHGKFGGYGEGQVGFTPGTTDDQVGLWLNTVITTSFNLDGSSLSFPGFTFEWIGVADEIASSQFLTEGVLVLSGPPQAIDLCSWALLLGPLGDLTFASKLERFATGFIAPRNGWWSVHLTIEPDGVSVKVFAGIGRSENSVLLVGSFTLASPVSPAIVNPQLIIGSPFVGPSFVTSGPPWGILTAETRAHDRPLDLDEINLRRSRSWASTESERPRNLWRYAGPFGLESDPQIFTVPDEDGGVDLIAESEILSPEQVSVGDGPIPENEQGTVGRTIQLIYGLVDNAPMTDSGARFSAHIIAELLAHVHEIRSRQAPMTIDLEIDALFDFDKNTNEITVSVGQPGVSFADFLEPDGDLRGQFIEVLQSPPDPNGPFEVFKISEDLQTLTTVGGFGGPFPNLNNQAVIRTLPPPAAEIFEELGLAVLDPGEIAELGRITATASGYQGTTGEEESQSGLFAALLDRRFKYTGTITVEPSFLNLSPVGEYTGIGGSISSREFLDILLVPNKFQWVPNDQSFRLVGYELPGVPAANVGESDHSGLTTIRNKRELSSLTLLYAKNNARQDPDAAATAVPEVNKARFAAMGQTVTRDNPNHTDRAIDLADPIVTAIQDRDGADAAIDRIAGLVFEAREWTKVPCETMRLYEIITGDTVRVFSLDPTKGWQAGNDAVVQSIKFSTENTMVLEVMSLSRSQTLTHNGDPVTHQGRFIHD